MSRDITVDLSLAASSAPISPPPPDTEPPETERVARIVYRLRLVAACFALTALCFLQDPGRIVGDTKVDLAVDPGSLLARVLHLWDPSGSFGQVQNQAYGYLWPMGPFFYLGHVVGLPAWVVQRLWWALILCVAFTGVVRLATRLGIGTQSTRIVAGLAFALAPRFLTSLGPISIESWPSALAPWVLLPLVGVLAGRPLWRAAARSALAVACVGGVNAAAALAVLPLPVLFLLTMRPRHAAVRLGAYWIVFIGLATAWWVGPLLLLGQYSPPFLNFIETANATTFPTHLVEVLRGTSHWVAYMADSAGPVWFAGWTIVANPIVVLDTALLTALGLLGLSRRGMPHRGWLITGLLVGVACVTFGHLGAVQGLFAEQAHALLDGALAPLRNVHKYDVILRLPLALGVAHMFGLLGRAGAAWLARPAAPSTTGQVLRYTLRPGFLYSMAIIALLGSAIPALATALPTRGSYAAVPQHWHDAAEWLDDQDERGAVLIVPASNFAEYEWGRTVDEIVQPLLRRPWAVRNAIPLAPPGTIRMLDELEDRIATGDGSPALAEVLARAGVKYLIVRNDLDYGTTGAARPLLVHQAIDRSPGIALARSFGPLQGEGYNAFGVIDQGLAKQYPAVEVYRVGTPVEVATAYPVSAMTVVAGGPESMLPLAEAGQLGPAPAVLSGDVPQGVKPGRAALTDDLRRREVAFGALHGGSATLTKDQPFRLDSPTHDYLPSWAAGHHTVAELAGVAAVEASSSRSDATSFGGPRPEFTPFAAIDDDPETGWFSDPGRSVRGQWWRVRFVKPLLVPNVGITFADGGAAPSRIRVTTDSGSETVRVGGTTAVVVLRVAAPTSFVQITVEDVDPLGPGGSVGINHVGIPNLVATRTLVTPPAPGASRPILSFSQAPAQTGGCYWSDNQPFCADGVARPSEDGRSIDRTVQLASGGGYRVVVRARAHPSEQLNAMLDRTMFVNVRPSSSLVPDPGGRGAMAADNNPRTAWIAGYGDREPSVRVSWFGARPIRHVRLLHDESLRASNIQKVRITSGSIAQEVDVNKKGEFTLPAPLIVDNFTITVIGSGFVRSVDPYTGERALQPVGISEIEFLDVADPRRDDDLTAPVSLPCGSGPLVRVADSFVTTAITATRRDLMELREVNATPCGKLQTASLPAGRQRIVAGATPIFDVTALALVPTPAAQAATATPLTTTIERWDATDRAVRVAARDETAVLAIRENVNPGWEATLDGAPLRSFTVDGWQQGWLVPAGAEGVVELTFSPDDRYALAMRIGAVGIILVLLAALVPWRRRMRSLPEAWGGWVALPLLGLAMLVILGGVSALVMLAVVVLADAALWWWGSPRLIRRLRWLTPAAAYAVAGVLLTARPWPRPDYLGDNQITQLLVLAALTVLWVSCGAGVWLAESTVGLALRSRGSSPPPPDTPPGT